MPPARWRDWYPHHIDRWKGSAIVQGMTDGAYRGYHNLIMAQWQAEDGRLPADERVLARLSGLFQRWPKFRTEVMENFPASGDGFANAVQYAEWQRAQKVYLQKSRQHPDSGQTVARVPVPEKAAPKPKARREVLQFHLPEWVPKDAWDGFVEMRQRIRAPLTARACERTIRDLAVLRDCGQDPAAVLDQSVQRSYRGVFAVKQEGGNGGYKSPAQKRTDANRDAVRAVLSKVRAAPDGAGGGERGEF